LIVPLLSAQPQMAAPNLPPAPPSAASQITPGPSSASPDTANPPTWESEPLQYSRLAAKPSSLTKLFTEHRTIVIGVGAGVGAVVLLALIVWMFFGRGGISEAMRYLPNDCLVVGTANVDELMSSSIYQQMKKDRPQLEDGERNLEQEMGIAPSNISRVTFAAGGKMDSPSDSDLVMVIRLKKAMSATDIRSNKKVRASQKDVKYEEVKIGSIAVFEETYRYSFGGEKAEREHGMAFCLPESTLIITCPKLEVLKKILERGKSPEFSEGMQNAMSEADFSKTMAGAVNIKGLMASDRFAREIKQNIGNDGDLKGLGGVDEQFLQNLLGLAFNASLDSSKATVNATLLCKDAKFAEDAKKILDGGQVVMRNSLKGMRGVPREFSDMIDAIKFSVSGAKVKGSLQSSLDPLSKWIKELPEDAPKSKRPTAKSSAARAFE